MRARQIRSTTRILTYKLTTRGRMNSISSLFMYLVNLINFKDLFQSRRVWQMFCWRATVYSRPPLTNTFI